MSLLTAQQLAQALIEAQGQVAAGQLEVSALTEAPGQILAAQVAVLVLMEQPSPQYSAQNALEAQLENAGNLYNAQHVALFLVCYDEVHPVIPEYIPMSDYFLPTLPGLMWTGTKKPKFGTNVATHVSGREVRVSNYAYPLYEWELKYEFLRSDSHNELQQLMGFYLARRGMFDSFLYADPQENNVLVNKVLGAGDNFKTEWTAIKTFGGFDEPVGYVNPATLVVYKAGVLQTLTTDYIFIAPNTIKFVLPPTIGQEIKASYTWYYRVRFGEDSQGYENFLYQLWNLKKMTIESIKP